MVQKRDNNYVKNAPAVSHADRLLSAYRTCGLHVGVWPLHVETRAYFHPHLDLRSASWSRMSVFRLLIFRIFNKCLRCGPHVEYTMRILALHVNLQNVRILNKHLGCGPHVECAARIFAPHVNLQNFDFQDLQLVFGMRSTRGMHSVPTFNWTTFRTFGLSTDDECCRFHGC